MSNLYNSNKKIEQGRKMIEVFVQEFSRTTRESRYKEKLLIEKFKRRMNRMIKRKLIKQNNLLKVLNSSISRQQTWIDIRKKAEEKKKDWEKREKQSF